MAIAFQGFSIKGNLSEAENDRDILNNLGISPIGDDISLLFNNQRNISSITVLSSQIQGNKIVIPDSLAVFSNKTKLTLGNTTYFVKDSNGIDTFSLSSNQLLSNTISSPLPGTYIRSDEVTLENISNFSIVRRNPDLNRVDTDTQLGFLNNSSSSSLLSSSNAKQLLESIEANLDFYKFRLQSGLSINKNFLTSRIFRSSGALVIKDLDGINNSSITNSSPGLFIYNPDTGTGIRAFSSSDNPWTAIGDTLEADASKITVKNLNFISNQISVVSKPNSFISQDITNTAIDSVNFTHKVPIKVNGEIYFLCMKLES